MNKTGMKLPIFESSNKQLMTIKRKTWPHGTNSHLPLDVYMKLNLSINSSWRCTGKSYILDYTLLFKKLEAYELLIQG